MAGTKHGPASTTVTRSTCPSSGSKTCVIPSLRPSSAAITSPPGRPSYGRRPSSPRTQVATRAWARERPRTQECDGDRSYELDLDVHAGRQVVESLERVDRLRRGLKDVDQPLVRADLEVLARVLVLERGADHAVDVLLGRQGHGPGHRGAGAHGRVDDLLGRRLDRRVVVGLEPDADLVLRERCHVLGDRFGGEPLMRTR